MGLQIFLFGKFKVSCADQDLPKFDTRKIRELLGYLVFYRDRPHPRESLARLLWEHNTTTAQSRKLLRQTLWQLQAALEASPASHPADILRLEPDWVSLNPQADLWSDVAVFERTFEQVKGIPAEALNAASAQALHGAIQLYQGDLLEGWYQDWCLYERERLQNIYLTMLEKLMLYSEAHRHYELGLSYGMCVLRYDRAHEPTHRRLMRLRYLAGDRTAALRQYGRCAAALKEELGVEPDKNTRALHQQILQDRLEDPPSPQVIKIVPDAIPPMLSQALEQIKQIQAALTDIQQRLLGEQ